MLVWQRKKTCSFKIITQKSLKILDNRPLNFHLCHILQTWTLLNWEILIKNKIAFLICKIMCGLASPPLAGFAFYNCTEEVQAQQKEETLHISDRDSNLASWLCSLMAVSSKGNCCVPQLMMYGADSTRPNIFHHLMPVFTVCPFKEVWCICVTVCKYICACISQRLAFVIC